MRSHLALLAGVLFLFWSNARAAWFAPSFPFSAQVDTEAGGGGGNVVMASLHMGNAPALRLGTIGFSSRRSTVALNALLADAVNVNNEVSGSVSPVPTPVTIYRYDDVPLLVTEAASFNGSYNDALLVYLEHTDLFDHNVALHKFRQGLASMMGNPAVKEAGLSSETAINPSTTDAELENIPRGKVPLMIAYSGTADEADLVELLLRQAWALLDETERVQVDNLFSIFDVQIIIIPQHLKSSAQAPEAVAAVKRALQSWDDAVDKLAPLRSLSDCISLNDGAAAVILDKSESAVRRGAGSKGFEIAQEGKSIALDWALDAARESAARLSRVTNPKDFQGFINNLMNAAEQIVKQHVQENTSKTSRISTVGNVALRSALRDLRLQLYERLLPLFRQQVRRVRQSVLSDFNNKVTAELGSDDAVELSVFVMDDLRNLKRSTMSKFAHEVQLLIPRNAPRTSWNALFDGYELSTTIEEYLQRREAEYRALGVLDRGGGDLRKPIDVSLHVFIPHPLGLRDYRQDALGGLPGTKSRDKLVYSGGSNIPVSDCAANQLVKPKFARHALQSEIMGLESQTSSSQEQRSQQSHLSLCRERSEFAREMMMMPLSIKAIAGRKDANAQNARARKGDKKKKPSLSATNYATSFQFNDIDSGAGGPPQKNPLRPQFGPERFLNLDAAPLREVKANLDALSKQGPSMDLLRNRHPKVLFQSLFSSLDTATDVVNKATASISGLDADFYKLPPVNY